MSTATAPPPRPLTAVETDLALAVSDTLARDTRRARMVALRWRPSRYATTHTLLEAESELADGSTLSMMLKRIDVSGSVAGRSDGKPSRVYDGTREALVYRTLLAGREPSVPFLYGVVRAAGASGGSWLMLERIRGRELYQFEAIERWEDAAAWLARFHARSASVTRFRVACRAARLLEHTPGLLRSWYSRACRFAEAREDESTRRALERLQRPYRRAAALALELPPTLIHGDFYPSNILLDESRGSVLVRPVDWELAGLGPGLLDLAALSSGDWSEPRRDRIANAYREATPPGLRMERAAFRRSLLACRLIVAIQWLGWSADWTPPREHRTDWLTTALNAAVQLDMRAP